MPTIREQVLAAVATNIGAGTLRGPVPSDVDPTATITGLVDGGDTAETDRSGTHQLVTLTFVVDSMAPLNGAAKQTKLDDLWSAVYSAVMNADRTLGGLADGIRYVSSDLDYANEDSIYVRAQLTFTVLFKFALNDPTVSTN